MNTSSPALLARIKRYQNVLHVALLVVLAYVPALLSSPGKMPADTKLYLYFDPARLTALFTFGPTPANAGVVRGTYTMHVVRRGSMVQLAPDEWPDRPQNYEKAGLDSGRFDGRIAHAGCSAFSLQRQPG